MKVVTFCISCGSVIIASMVLHSGICDQCYKVGNVIQWLNYQGHRQHSMFNSLYVCMFVYSICTFYICFITALNYLLKKTVDPVITGNAKMIKDDTKNCLNLT